MDNVASRLDDTLLGLADPTRRAILAQLAEDDARVTDLAAQFPISLNSVSKHIRMLERAGLVRRRVHGREHVLSLEPASLDQVADWIEQQRRLWKHRLRKLDALLREEERVGRKKRGRR